MAAIHHAEIYLGDARAKALRGGAGQLVKNIKLQPFLKM
jgi:hypothetical protein